ncbi:hypothetical protein HU200_052383 [Digitaria exilis]|uniref:Protein XRI1 n=1 Tax=Digitaria exilis TaxID=1010633 RepID=A0A835ANZ8_9POAL|nr:hypothetical protein HU200_052383 [Digitaria exilis]
MFSRFVSDWGGLGCSRRLAWLRWGRIPDRVGLESAALVLFVVLPIGAEAPEFTLDDDLLGFFGNQTPLRDCRDFFADIPDVSCKETLEPEESREAKRRRTLEYPSESSQSEAGTHETSSFVASEATMNSLLSTDAPYWQDNHLEHCEPDQMPCTQESVSYVDDQAGISGSSEIAPVTESLIMHETRKLSTLKVSKGILGGNSSLVKGKQNITTTIACPFTFIKPSWDEGDVATLQDINQRIRAPPKRPPEILGTSPYSGKPVIGKTRIMTDGGKGSITILRTKG